ncbi:hypothetical protein N577_015455 [Lacticaseibacillus rhamnosus 2166]|nr:hypothetical protein N577_015455 [Lacticaseibacillus rhamnosus 2166]
MALAILVLAQAYLVYAKATKILKEANRNG